MNEAGNHADNRAETVPPDAAEIDREIATLQAELSVKKLEVTNLMYAAKNRMIRAELEGGPFPPARQPSTDVNPGFVYFISDGEAVKIGYSAWPLTRMADLQSSTPRELKLLAKVAGSIGTERGLHSKLSDLRLRGEWFKLDKRILGLIEDLRNGVPLPD